jgi:hypothetical protein
MLSYNSHKAAQNNKIYKALRQQQVQWSDGAEPCSLTAAPVRKTSHWLRSWSILRSILAISTVAMHGLHCIV